MTRYVKNELDPIKNPDKSNIPITVPIWDSTRQNPSSFQYRNLMSEEGRRFFEGLSKVPAIDDKMSLLNDMGAGIPEEVERICEEYDVNSDQLKGILSDIGTLGGEKEPKEVVSELAKDGYAFIFIFDEMVSSTDKEESQSVLKWFKDHLYPYVGLILFCHPDVSDAIRGEMQDQAKRRNMEEVLEVGSETYDIKEDIVINIRGKQDEIIDLEKLLQEYFSDVFLENQEENEYGPFNKRNIEWMKSLLKSEGLIGHLINGIKLAVEHYAENLSEGNHEKRIGAYLFDECSRCMSHVRLKERLEAHTSIDSTKEKPLVWKAKEIITGSRNIDEMNEEERKNLLEARVLIEDQEEEEIKINPTLKEYEEIATEPITSVRQAKRSEVSLRTFQETVRNFTNQMDEDRDKLRRNIERGISNLISYFNSRQINKSESSALVLPDESETNQNYLEIESSRSTGRAEKLKIKDGNLSGYGYSFLIFSLLDDEELNDPQIKDKVLDLYEKDNGIVIVTDKPPGSINNPDWFDDPIEGQHWSDPKYTWKDVTEIVHVKKLRNFLGAFQQIQNLEIEDDSEILEELEKIQRRPETPDLYNQLNDLYLKISQSVENIHRNIYSKYNGPTANECEAFKRVLEKAKETGFISEGDLCSIRSDYGLEIETLIDKGAIIEMEENEDKIIYLKEDFGKVSKLGERNIKDSDDLFPVPPSIFDELEEFHQMEKDRVTKDEDIEDQIEELDQKIDLINFFITEDSGLEEIENYIQNTNSDVFEEISEKITDLLGTSQEKLEVVMEKFSNDQEFWDKISELETENNVSPIHRALFFAKLHKDPPAWADDFLETEEDYPDLIYEVEEKIREILGDFEELKAEIEGDFAEESGNLEDDKSDIEEFMELEIQSENISIDEFEEADLEEAELEELSEFDFNQYIKNIAETERKRKNISNAASLLTRIKNSIDSSFKEDLDVASIDELEEKISEYYIEPGRKILKELVKGDTLYSETDEPEILANDFNEFCDNLASLIRKLKTIIDLKREIESLRKDMEDYEGENPEEKIDNLNGEKDDLEKAKSFLKLKNDHCEVCKSKWEDLSSERQKEIEKNIEDIKEGYPELTLENSDDKIEEVQKQIKQVEEKKKSIEDKKEEIEEKSLTSHIQELNQLRQKYISE